MATFQVTDEFVKYLGQASIDLDSHTFKAALTLTDPTKAGTTNIASVTQIAATGGYDVVTIANPVFTETGAGTGIWEFDCDPFEWTASGANFAEARYVVIFDYINGSPQDDPVVGFLDYGGSFVVKDGNTFKVTPGTSGVLRMTVS
jgi:hypothetical protein